MSTINIQYYKTPQAEFILGSYSERLCLLDFRYRKMRSVVDVRVQRGLKAKFVEQDDLLLAETRSQIDEYLLGQRTEFDLPLLTVGSEFQERVWDALREVPYGETSTYLELARRIGKENAVRAVASANGANAIALIIPCHRIIGSNGELIGYGGGIPLKQKLLKLENSMFSLF
ncbi:methylated-DNA--[protein]-cysteine S-methyltransferase [Litoribrevibacter albus]|uniref:Methylated-DNA--protein-cysteine methyltransferase n=1 Tax=Litoribrevibacter albus TaxID=1473156 RepID=A0AA37W8F3_9GAMM|nr:methylated-DNA--[protein]-cysteine S-methyltransferase [Litoribrevibacter albus]GLQ31964.1 methylated-DNA--protein-cysteine methyltransferase [Litoribrevibacter albus]